MDLRFVAAVARGNLRLLTGMIRANRPWRLIVRLSRALAAAAAAVALALVTSDLWKLSDALDWIRLLALMVLSVGATVLWLIVSHRLWERPRDGPAASRPCSSTSQRRSRCCWAPRSSTRRCSR